MIQEKDIKVGLKFIYLSDYNGWVVCEITSIERSIYYHWKVLLSEKTGWDYPNYTWSKQQFFNGEKVAFKIDGKDLEKEILPYLI